MKAALAPDARGAWAALPGLLALLFVLACWPGLDQPGKIPREVMLLAGAPLLMAAAIRCRAWPDRWLMGLLALPLVVGLLGVARAPTAERLPVMRDALVLATPWLVAIAVSSLGAARLRWARMFTYLENGAIAALAVMSGLGLAQAWFGFDGVPQSDPPGATFVNRNVAAQTVVALLPFVFPCLLAGRPAWKRWSAGLSGGLAAAFLVATRSRGAWLAFGAGLLLLAVLPVLRRRRSGLERARFALAPLGLAVALFGLSVFVPNRGEAPQINVRQTLLTLRSPIRVGESRLAIWRNTAALVADDSLLGVGAGRFVVEYPRYQAVRVATPGFGLLRQPDHVHNDFLEYAAELGLPAALALFLMMVVAVARVGRNVRMSESVLDAARCAAVGASLVAVVVHGLVSFPLHSPASAFLAWLGVGVACRGRPVTGQPSSLGRVALVLALVGTAAGLWIGAREIRSQRALVRGTQAAFDERCAAAVRHAERVPEYAPWKRRDVGLSAMVHFYCNPDVDETLKVLEHALLLQPYQINLLLAAGNRLLDAERIDDAGQAFDRAMEIEGSLAQAWLGLAKVAHARSQPGLALAHCRQALRFEPRLEPALAFCEPAGYLP